MWGFGGFNFGFSGIADLTTEITGNGTVNYHAKFVGAQTIGNSLVYDNAVSVSIGTTSPSASALFQMNSITQGFLPPRMTTVQKNAIGSPVQGLIVYDTTINAPQYYNGSSWVGVTPGSGTLNYVVKWTPDGATLGNSIIQDDGTCVGLNQAPDTGTSRFIINAGNQAIGAKVTNLTSGNYAYTGEWNSGAGFAVFADTEVYVGAYTTSNLYLYTSSGVPRLKITHSTGNVGIGTGSTDASYRLTVTTADASYGFVHTNGTIQVGSFIGGGHGEYGTITNHPLQLFAFNGGGANNAYIEILANGCIGIGETSPTAKLQVTASNSQTGFYVSGVANNQYLFQFVNATGTLGSYYSGSFGAMLLGTDTNSDFALYSNGSPRIYIESTGQVGVGITVGSPTAQLHIAAGTATASTAPLKFTSGTNLTTAEAGAMEYNGVNLFFTRSGTTRQTVLTANVVTTESVASDTTITVNIAGTDYKLLARA